MEAVTTANSTVIQRHLLDALNETGRGAVIFNAENQKVAFLIGNDFGDERVIYTIGKTASIDDYITSLFGVQGPVSVTHLHSDGKDQSAILFVGPQPFKLSLKEMGNVGMALDELGIKTFIQD